MMGRPRKYDDQILEALAGGPLSVAGIQERFEVQQPALHYALKRLEAEGKVVKIKQRELVTHGTRTIVEWEWTTDEREAMRNPATGELVEMLTRRRKKVERKVPRAWARTLWELPPHSIR